MLRYRLVQKTEDFVKYEYVPESDKPSGVVVMNLHSGKCHIEKESSGDIGRRYAQHFISKLRELFFVKQYKDSGIVAWY